MKILAIETSCDETAAAVVEDGARVLSSVVHSQINIFEAYGGVIPEVAARSHIEMILPVVDGALRQFWQATHPETTDWDIDLRQLVWRDIDAVACTTMPGLIGSLMVGSLTARTLALVHHKPFYAIHHVEAHAYANFITEVTSNDSTSAKTSAKHHEISRERVRQNPPKFPVLGLIVSGGHSQIVLWLNHGDYKLLGQTADDAVGEAFDKVAKILGLPYPGGPAIAQAAETGDAHKYALPKAHMSGRYDFSFSGLKTAVLRRVQQELGLDHTFPSSGLAARLSARQVADFAASFQRVAVETLVDKLILASREFRPRSVIIAGGVSANKALRDEITRRFIKEDPMLKIEFPPLYLCTDNAMMVGSLAYFKSQITPADDPRTTEIIPSISMTQTAWNRA